jgi:hypothetical protein
MVSVSKDCFQKMPNVLGVQETYLSRWLLEDKINVSPVILQSHPAVGGADSHVFYFSVTSVLASTYP